MTDAFVDPTRPPDKEAALQGAGTVPRILSWVACVIAVVALLWTWHSFHQTWPAVEQIFKDLNVSPSVAMAVISRCAAWHLDLLLPIAALGLLIKELRVRSVGWRLLCNQVALFLATALFWMLKLIWWGPLMELIEQIGSGVGK